jgi:F0F1-type ATP synthase membrane subunit b/b'
MLLDPNFWYAVAFIIFFALLARPLWRLAVQMLDGKRLGIEKDIEDAAHMHGEALGFFEEAQRQKQEAQERVDAMLDHTQGEIQRLQEESKQELILFSQSQERQLRERLQSLDAAGLKELTQSMVGQAVVAARAMIEKTLDKKMTSHLIDQTVEEIKRDQGI